ncbi:hypothetical protein GWI33_019847 [Rhynchophorus ferrugineus]|uniref:Uncharacterized protein n=1 Tax=Rhynchophorus ferrugineus TaxID=354439 RepID=A0A834M047_RHYFE|nr:hypothetical protein GWI33_019847 [Rhynchophorus ferrugineus]
MFANLHPRRNRIIPIVLSEIPSGLDRQATKTEIQSDEVEIVSVRESVPRPPPDSSRTCRKRPDGTGREMAGFGRRREEGGGGPRRRR